MPASRQARGDIGEFFGESGADGLGGVEESAASAGDFGEHAARDDVAGRQFRVLVQRRHEPLSGAIDQNGALAAQGFGGQRRGIAADVDGGGMELHEFGVGDPRPGARAHGQRRARRLRRIGGQRIERADAAGRQNRWRAR